MLLLVVVGSSRRNPETRNPVVIQHVAVRDERRVIGDRVHLFGSSLNLSFSPPSWSTHYIKWLAIFGEYFFRFTIPFLLSIRRYLTPTPCL